MKKLAFAVSVLLVVVVGGCGATVLLVGAAGIGQAAAACTPATGLPGTIPVSRSPAPTASVPTGSGSLPVRIGPYRGEQITNAAQVILAGQHLGIDARGQAVGVMTAIGESTLINVDHGDAVGPDSRGIFQQRANGAWGSYADRMTPRTAATTFYTALRQLPGWEQMAPTLAAHAVQHNADPYYYQPFWTAAVLIVGTLSGDPNLATELPATGALPCAPGPAGGGGFTGPGGPFTPQACSVAPDPSTGTGCLTPRMAALYRQLVARGWHPGCYRPTDAVPGSDHPLGRACDAPPTGTYGVLPDAAQKAAGDALAAALQASAALTGVHYLIWYGQIWSVDRASEGWRPYNGAGVYTTAATSPGGITGGHFDHVHISVY